MSNHSGVAISPPAMRDKTDAKSRDDLLRDILQAMARQNAQNWPHIQSEVIGLLKEELSQ
jgi:hypothetical protein